MPRISKRIWMEDRAQDLIEYSILIAAVVLVAAGMFLSAGGGVKGIWKSGDTQLTAANTAAGGNQTSNGGGGNHHGGGNHPGRQND